jgi:hypothetical protein
VLVRNLAAILAGSLLGGSNERLELRDLLQDAAGVTRGGFRRAWRGGPLGAAHLGGRPAQALGDQSCQPAQEAGCEA